MTANAPTMRGGLRQVLGLHAIGVLGSGSALLAATLALRGAAPGFVILTGGALLAVVLAASLWWLQRTLRPSSILEAALARVGDGESDPFELPTLAISSRAGAGWNRLTQLGRSWRALHDLEHSLSTLRSQDGSGEASQLLSLIDALPDGIALTDEGDLLTHANEAFAAICGAKDRASILNRKLSEVWPEDVHWSSMAFQSLGQAQFGFDLSVVSNDGATRMLRCTRLLRTAQQQSGKGYVWVLRDVTQQRLSDEMRDKFLAAATHELRTPLANLRAYAETLASGEASCTDSQKRFFNVIQSESVRLAQLVDDLLDVSRMQAGALAIDRKETDMGRLIEDVAVKVSAQMKAHNIDYRCELPPKFPKAMVDKSKLTAALVNLLGNAAKYTPDGGRVTFRVDIGEDQMEFSVADTGIGIAPDELAQVFERFFRSADPRVRDIPGSGLGLALTQEIARLHGGELAVTSEVNVGSIFRLTIPLKTPE